MSETEPIQNVDGETLEHAAVQLERASGPRDYEPIIAHLRAMKNDREQTKQVIDEAWNDLNV